MRNGRALVIGGGLAGAGVATLLAGQGRDVVLLEREPGPHDKVCGEFLSYEAVGSLRRMGVDPAALGAQTVRRVAIFQGRRRILVDLPFIALSVSRRILDDALIRRAAAQGATVQRGAKVTGLQRQDGGWQAQLADGQTIAASEVFLATGKHDLRRWPRSPGWLSDMIGFKTFLRLSVRMTDAIAGQVELHLFPGGYVGMELVEDGRTNLCLVVKKAVFAEQDRAWPSLLAYLGRQCPALAERLDEALPSFERPLAVAAIPYGYVRSNGEAGLWRLGDQAAVIPSFVGDGMAMALHSAELAASFVAAGKGAQSFQRKLASQVRQQMRCATFVSRVMLGARTQPLAGLALELAPGLIAAVAKRTRSPHVEGVTTAPAA